MINITRDFITEEQEKQIITSLPPTPPLNKKGRNRIFRYGSPCAYGGHLVSTKIPDVYKQFPFEFDSVTINEYLKDQFIDWHIDNANSGNEIIVVSLLGDAVLMFRRGEEMLTYDIPARSLVRFSEELRWSYQHSVIAKDHRYSIVLRKCLV